jgi:Ca2+-binding EF-hand superfamily protein
MGNDVSKGSNHMAIAAMAHVTHLEARELLMLQKKFAELARREGNPQNINREHFEEALQLVGITENDKEILDRLFIMFDISGDNQINFKEFLAGIAPLASGSTADKLNLAFQLYDVHGTGEWGFVVVLFWLGYVVFVGEKIAMVCGWKVNCALEMLITCMKCAPLRVNVLPMVCSMDMCGKIRVSYMDCLPNFLCDS